MEWIKKFVYTHRFQLLGFVISLLALWNAVWFVQILYGVVLCFIVFITRGKVKFLLSLIVTAVLVLFLMPYVIKGAHIVSGKVMSMLVPLPELIYDGRKMGEEKPVISIVIPAYNYADYVSKAIESAATQNIDVPYEVVVVDDASTDKTLERAVDVAKRYSNVRVYANKKNRGVITNKNTGVSLADGEWIFNLDADDYITEDALTKLYGLVRDYKADLAYTWYVMYGGKNGIYEACDGRVRKTENCIPNFILYQKKDWRDNGGYSYLFSKGVEDWAFQMAFYLKNKKIVRSEQAVAYYLEKRLGRNWKARKFYWALWWIMQENFSSEYGWDIRLLLFAVGFNKNLLKNLFHKLRQLEDENFENLSLYEVQ